MLMTLFMFTAFVMLFVGGHVLVQGASELSEKIGLSKAFVGLVVVSLGTSAPELAFGLGSALTDHGALVAGNVMGSNIVNIGLTLGLAWIIRAMPVGVAIRWRDILFLLFTTLLGVYLIQDSLLTRLEGLILVLLAVVFVLSGYRDSTKQRQLEMSSTDEGTTARDSTKRSVLQIVFGIVLLVAGAELLIVSAVSLAQRFGVSEAVIALTLTAFGTGIPEVVATSIAAFRREFELAIGNIVGSNFMNLTLVMGVSALAKPLQAVSIGAVSTIAVIVFTLLMTILLRLKLTNRIVGAVLLSGYSAYVAFLLYY